MDYGDKLQGICGVYPAQFRRHLTACGSCQKVPRLPAKGAGILADRRAEPLVSAAFTKLALARIGSGIRCQAHKFRSNCGVRDWTPLLVSVERPHTTTLCQPNP